MCPSGAAVLNDLWRSQPLPVDRVHRSLSSTLTLQSAEVPALMDSVNISGAISRLIPNRPHGSRMSNAASVMLSAVRWARGRERGKRRKERQTAGERKETDCDLRRVRWRREEEHVLAQRSLSTVERLVSVTWGLVVKICVWSAFGSLMKGYLLHRGTWTLLPHLTCLGIVPWCHSKLP